MKDIQDIEKIYFIGIGGIGMSSLARYFRFHGKSVSGYDRTETALTRSLAAEGIAVHYADDPALVPRDIDLVVYTPAIPVDHRELNFCRQQQFPMMKRSEVLGLITQSSFNICVAGTHGKTTVTTMIAHILRHSGYGCNAFLGGISVNYNSNFWSSERNCCVVEADEYDRSFLRLSPNIEVITAMDADHLDIYETAAAVEQAFIDFSGRLKPGGWLLHREGLARERDLLAKNRRGYSLTRQSAAIHASAVKVVEGSYRFRVEAKDWAVDGLELRMGGLHNVENMTAAIAVAQSLGIEADKIKAAVLSFRGVKRRFEFIVSPSEPGRAIYIDDYAHHPEELRALIEGVRNLYPEKKLVLIFQPHLFSRTRDFADGFAAVLDQADEVMLLPIYPARELPIEGVSSGMISEKMKGKKVVVQTRQEILDRIKKNKQELAAGAVLVTAGAGDIDTMVEPIAEILKTNN